jgi:Glycosyl transferase family 2
MRFEEPHQALHDVEEVISQLDMSAGQVPEKLISYATMSVAAESKKYTHILHPQFFDSMLRGAEMRRILEDAARASASEIETHVNDGHPNVSIVIRTRNNRSNIERLFDDIGRLAFQGEIQIVLADTESNDGTVGIAQAVARNMGLDAIIIPITQRGFRYPAGLNKAFEGADHPYILSLVGHERLSNTRTLDAAVRGSWSQNFGGAYGPAIPNENATRSEQFGSLILGVEKALRESAVITKVEVGALASDRAVINRDAWRELGGYDAAGISIVRDPVLTTHHTHGLGPIRSLVQLIDWYRISRPRKFNPALHRFIRPEQV